MAALDFTSLKSYVTGGAPRQLSSGTALLDVQHSLIQQRFVEIPFDVRSSLDAVKDKIHSLCGTPPNYQQLFLNGPTGTLLSPASATDPAGAHSSSQLSLSSFGVRGGGGSQSGGGHYLYVVDVDPYALGRGGALHDVSQVAKYVMSDDEYRKRDNTYRAFKERQKQQDPNWQSLFQQRAAQAKQQQQQQHNNADDSGAAAAESVEEVRERISVGSRCVIQPADRRGTVKCQTSRQATTHSTAQHSTAHIPRTQSECQMRPDSASASHTELEVHMD